MSQSLSSLIHVPPKAPRAAKRPRSPRIDVVVSKETIDASKQRDSSHCMIAEAIKAAFPTAKNVSVDIQTIRLTDPAKKLRYTYLTPRIAQIPLVQFDQGLAPAPFKFVLRQGQVTLAGSHESKRKGPPRQLTLAQKENIARAGSVSAVNKRNGLKKAVITKKSATDAGVRNGGRTPPTTPFAKRRAFGIRALEF